MARSTTNSSNILERFSGTTTSTTTTPTNNVIVVAKSNNGNKRPPIIIYPTVTPESIVVPIVSCIFGFPLLALTVICCLRRRAKLARERARRRNCELDRGELSVVRLSPVKARPRAVSLIRSPRPPPTLELDTVLEERSDPEQTTLSQIEITPDREVGSILFSTIGAVGSAAVSAATCARDS
ncbi:uncharacterized protein LOC113392292 [Vanessa tameamea]|uniref:Uncharacterized protein LOC113392292 n=1 Tax=Vanessa tameamea TaxID=334116 RepID=A0A8B8HHV8_VANTA|nr:uncharacterized protein LOC113392292 [Vanessa tameamea]